MTTQRRGAPLVVYVDVDETLVRNYGTTRIPLPDAVRHVRELYEQGAELYCWSSGGADYARRSAEECAIADCFVGFLPKPHVLIDDQHPVDWRRLLHAHPLNCAGRTVESYRAELTTRRKGSVAYAQDE